jgi:hypothetical protein
MNWQAVPQVLGFVERERPQSVQSDRGTAGRSGGATIAGNGRFNMGVRLA